MTQTLYASFNDASLAEKAAGALMDHGVVADDISVIAHETYGQKHINDEPGQAVVVTERGVGNVNTATSEIGAGHTEAAAKGGISTTTPADAAAGAATGAGIGLGLGILGGLAS